MERMDGYRIPREGEAISYYLPAATFPFPFPNDTALVPCGHRRSESRPPWCRVFTDCGFGGPCWGVISVFLGGRSLGRLPSSFWSRGYPRRREKHADIAAIGGIFCLKKRRIGQLAARHRVARQSRQTGKFRCGGVVGCSGPAKSFVIRSQDANSKRPESRQPDADDGRMGENLDAIPRIEILSESRAPCDSAGDGCAPSRWAQRNTDLRGREASPPTAVQEVATPR